MFWKEAFDKSIKDQLKEAYPDFCACFDRDCPVSVRINPEKYQGVAPSEDKVAWCPEGYYLRTRPSFTLDPVLHAGGYYVQEASSMFLDFVMKSIFKNIKGLKILDLCAAPGGKSTILANYIGESGLLVANEVSKPRAFIVKENLIKWGNPNVVVTNHDPDDFEGLAGFFDVVLVDAPCSGEGLFRKDRDAAEEWSVSNVEKCTGRQKRILNAACRLVKSGGYLIYSTCTYNDAENTENARWILEQFDYKEYRLPVPEEMNIVEKKSGYQFYPHRVRGEGFYISLFQNQENNTKALKSEKLVLPYQKMDKMDLTSILKYLKKPEDFAVYMKKNGELLTFQKAIIPDLSIIFKRLDKVFPITQMGSFKGKDFIPEHELAMRIDCVTEGTLLEVDFENALNYLRKTDFKPVNETDKFGWQIVRYGTYHLGWAKVLPGRINNYYPTEYRIRLK